MHQTHKTIILFLGLLFMHTSSKGQSKSFTLLFLTSIENNQIYHLSTTTKFGVRLYNFENKFTCFLYEGLRYFPSSYNLRTVTGLKLQSFQYNLPQTMYLSIDIGWDNKENPFIQDVIHSYVLLGTGYNLNQKSSVEINFGLFNAQSKIALSFSRTFQLKVRYKKRTPCPSP